MQQYVKTAEGVANSVDPDQTSPSELVYMSLVMRKPVFDLVRLKPACSATETS